MNPTIVIEYRTQKDYCQCCEQKLPSPQISEIREFELNPMRYRDWREVIEWEDDLQEIIREYVYDTIRFFAVSSFDNILIENSEFDKVKQFILSNVTKNEKQKTNNDWICQNCKHEWNEPSPLITCGDCPKCGSDYVEHY